MTFLANLNQTSIYLDQTSPYWFFEPDCDSSRSRFALKREFSGRWSKPSWDGGAGGGVYLRRNRWQIVKNLRRSGLRRSEHTSVDFEPEILHIRHDFFVVVLHMRRQSLMMVYSIRHPNCLFLLSTVCIHQSHYNRVEKCPNSMNPAIQRTGEMWKWNRICQNRGEHTGWSQLLNAWNGAIDRAVATPGSVFIVIASFHEPVFGAMRLLLRNNSANCEPGKFMSFSTQTLW